MKFILLAMSIFLIAGCAGIKDEVIRRSNEKAEKIITRVDDKADKIVDEKIDKVIGD